MENQKYNNEYRLRIKDLKDEDKPREKLAIHGVGYLSDEELLAVILGTGSKKHNAIELARNILNIMKKENNHMDITLNELMEIEGVGISKASKIIAALEFSKRLNIRKSFNEYTINSPNSVANIFMEELRNKLKECFYILLLNTKNRIISKELISEGTLNSSLVHPREVFKQAIKKSANSIILVHNHPSGDITPSKDDIQITKRLVETGKIVGIQVLDHLIIGDGQFLSLKEKEYF